MVTLNNRLFIVYVIVLFFMLSNAIGAMEQKKMQTNKNECVVVIRSVKELADSIAKSKKCLIMDSIAKQMFQHSSFEGKDGDIILDNLAHAVGTTLKSYNQNPSNIQNTYVKQQCTEFIKEFKNNIGQVNLLHILSILYIKEILGYYERQGIERMFINLKQSSQSKNAINLDEEDELEEFADLDEEEKKAASNNYGGTVRKKDQDDSSGSDDDDFNNLYNDQTVTNNDLYNIAQTQRELIKKYKPGN